MKKILLLIALATTIFSQAQVKKKIEKPKVEKEWVNPVKLTKEERSRPYMDEVLKTRDSLTPEEAERRRKNIAAGNPFAKYGYYPKVATLSKGKYLEFHDKDSIVVIGSVKYNTKQKKIVEFLEIDLSDPDAQPIGDTHGMWMSPDPLSEEFPSWSPYNFVFNNPIRFIDPDGRAPLGDYYTKFGQYLGSDGKNDNKVYVADSKSTSTTKDGTTKTTFNNAKELSITHSQFQKMAATVYGESSAYKSGVTVELAQEMGAIASVHQNNKTAYGANSAQAKLFTNTDLEDRTGKMQLANWSIINAVTGGKDYSNGANMWDGAEQAMFPASDTRASTGRFELHMNTMGWSITDAHYSKWKQNVGSSFQAPQIRVSPMNYPQKGYYNAGKIRLQSTAVYGSTIFWKSN
ncbi:MAG: hypothetical protein QM564_06895 [Bergeyella sp.]